MSDISKESFVKNGMDIAELFNRSDSTTQIILEPSIGFACTAIVAWLNNNGHPKAAQALDDEWYPRSEQWWREPDGFDGYYLNGQEKRDQIFGKEL